MIRPQGFRLFTLLPAHPVRMRDLPPPGPRAFPPGSRLCLPPVSPRSRMVARRAAVVLGLARGATDRVRDEGIEEVRVAGSVVQEVDVGGERVGGRVVPEPRLHLLEVAAVLEE